VTKRALDAHRLDAAVGVGEGRDANDRFELEQRDRRRWIVEIDLPAAICFFKVSGSASASTLSPTDSAVFGDTPGPTPPFFSPAMALCS